MALMTPMTPRENERPERPSWDRYFLLLADAAATRATCPRLSVGCVLVRDRDVIATGYNGALPGQPHCVDVGCDPDVDGRCTRACHAEVNAVARAARRGVSTAGATAYLTHRPCFACTKVLIVAGVTRIVYQSLYRPDPRVEELCERAGVSLVGPTPRSGAYAGAYAGAYVGAYVGTTPTAPTITTAARRPNEQERGGGDGHVV
jgi:dCMP deaminase